MSLIPMRMFFLIAGGVSIGLAGLQYNDSNALVWAAMYLVTGVITLARGYRPLPRWLPALGAAACFAGAAWTATHEILNPGCLIGTDLPGPLLCGVLLAVVAWKARAPLGAA